MFSRIGPETKRVTSQTPPVTGDFRDRSEWRTVILEGGSRPWIRCEVKGGTVRSGWSEMLEHVSNEK